MQPLIFPVSSRLALKAKIQTSQAQSPPSDATSTSLDASQPAASSNAAPISIQSNEMWKESKFGALEEYVLTTLSAEERTKLKLENPLGIAENLISHYTKSIEERYTFKLKVQVEKSN